MKNAHETEAKTRILVVDDHPLLRDGVVQLINRQPDLAVCGEAESITSLQDILPRCKPHLLLLDFRLGTADTIELIKGLIAQYPKLLILVFSQFDETLFAERALRAGAKGYLMKHEATEEVITAIRTVLRQEVYVSRKIAVQIFQQSLEAKVASHVATMKNLSDRELHIFQLLGSGFSTRQIATELKLSVKTIDTHRENIKHKLGLSCAAELIQCATNWVRENLLPLSNGLVAATWPAR